MKLENNLSPEEVQFLVSSKQLAEERLEGHETSRRISRHG